MLSPSSNFPNGIMFGVRKRLRLYQIKDTVCVNNHCLHMDGVVGCIIENVCVGE